MTGDEERIREHSLWLQPHQDVLALFDLGHKLVTLEPSDEAISLSPVQAKEISNQRSGKVKKIVLAKPLGYINRGQLFRHPQLFLTRFMQSFYHSDASGANQGAAGRESSYRRSYTISPSIFQPYLHHPIQAESP